MSETLADFLIKIGVDTGQSLKRIERIDKALDRVKGTKGTTKQVAALAAVQRATLAVSKVEAATSKDFLKQTNTRLKLQGISARVAKQRETVAVKQVAIKAVVQKAALSAAKVEMARSRDFLKLAAARLKMQRKIFKAIPVLKNKTDPIAESAKRNIESLRKETTEYKKLLAARLKMQRKIFKAIPVLKNKIDPAAEAAKRNAESIRKEITASKQLIAERLKLHGISIRADRQRNTAAVKEVNFGSAQLRMLSQISAVSRQSNAEGRMAMKSLSGQVRNMEKSALGVAKMKRALEDALPRQRAFNRELQKGGRFARSMKQSMNNMLRSYVSVFAAIQGGRAIVDTTRKFEGMQNGLVAVTGDMDTAKAKFEEIKETARGLGVALEPAIDGFVKLTVAGREKFDVSEIREMHMAMLESSVAFGLSADETNGAIKAMSQMMGKGKVTAEEFRGQLAERMPVAFDAMQKALGVTTAQFAEMLDKGQIGLEVLPKFAIELRKISRAGGLLEAQQKSLNAGMNRFLLTTQELTVAFSESGVLEGLKQFFDGLSQGLKNTEPLVRALGVITGEVLKLLGKAFHVLGTILGLLGETVKLVIDAFSGFSGIALTGFLGWIFKGKATKIILSLTRALKGFFIVMRTGMFASLAASPIGWIIAAGLAIGGIIAEVRNFFADEKDKKIGIFSAPEGFKTGIEEIMEKLGPLWYEMILAPFRDIKLFGVNLIDEVKPKGTAPKSSSVMSTITGGAGRQTGLLSPLLAIINAAAKQTPSLDGTFTVKVVSDNLSPETEIVIRESISDHFKNVLTNTLKNTR